MHGRLTVLRVHACIMGSRGYLVFRLVRRKTEQEPQCGREGPGGSRPAADAEDTGADDGKLYYIVVVYMVLCYVVLTVLWYIVVGCDIYTYACMRCM